MAKEETEKDLISLAKDLGDSDTKSTIADKSLGLEGNTPEQANQARSDKLFPALGRVNNAQVCMGKLCQGHTCTARFAKAHYAHLL